MPTASSAACDRPKIDAFRRAARLVAFAWAAGSGLAYGSTGPLESPVAAQAGPSVRDLVPDVRPASAPAGAATAGARRVGAIEAELVADRTAVAPGAAVRLGLRLRHDARWHTYWRNPGDSGLATQFAPVLPSGWSAGPIEWPAPQRFALGPLANYGYEGEVVLPVTVRAPADAAAGPVQASATVQWLACREVCVPGEATLSLSLPVLTSGQAAPSRWAPLFDAMAVRTPAGAPLEARWHAADGGLSLVFASLAGAAEFFPYDPGVIEPAAPQTLHALGAQRRRLELVRAQTPPAGAATLPAVPDRLAGVLVADGRPIEIVARLDPSPAPAGEPIGVAVARPGPAGGGSAATPAGAGALALAIGSALLGGLLLNLMPCVFPVIGLKLLGFAHDGAGHAGRARRHAWAFGAGILTAFLALAAGLLALRSAGQAVGWGFQLQSPVFVAAMALLFVAVGLNFSGVYEVGSALTRLGTAPAGEAGAAGPHRRLLGSFGSGLLATLVATPCTAPFMGSAVGFTLGQPAAIVLAVFAAVGVGMGLPYVLLAHAPSLARRLPRPGRWMQTLRQLLAFPMYATAAWLAWVLVQQSDADAVLRLGLAMVAVGLAGWVWGRFAQHGARPAAMAAIGSIGAALWLIWPIPGAAPGAPPAPGAASAGRGEDRASWEPYDEARLQALRGQGRVVLVDFTAAWCISCQANKRLVLDARPVRAAFARRDVALLRADWTRRDPRITAALAAFGRNGVPLYLVYRPDADAPTILPELLTASMVLRAIGG